MKEMIVHFRKSLQFLNPLHINRSIVENVKNTKFLSAHIARTSSRASTPIPLARKHSNSYTSCDG